MRAIKDLIAINPRYLSVKNIYGVEVEVEGVNLPNPGEVHPCWRLEKDSSLKTAEAWEYVLDKPTTYKGALKAIDLLDFAYQTKKSVVHDSVRAGVHVHLNVQNWNIKQLMTFSTCYYILEDLLLHWCGENREGNLFCLRTKDAEYVLFRLYDALTQRNLGALKTENIRYSSLNYCSLFKYGTVEFRGMRGTPDLSLVKEWVSMIEELKNSSLRFSSPAEVLNHFSGEGETEFVNTLLPTFANKLNMPNKERAIIDAIRRVQLIAFGVDWDSISQAPINIFEQVGEGF